MTQSIDVSVLPAYLPQQSNPDNNRYAFSYTITICNTGDEPAQLMYRHWIITDANGKIEEVKGEGVVGEQPHLEPGECFEYTSGAYLETSVGTMRGSYQMVTDEGDSFNATIPEFVLTIPRTLH